MKNNLLFRLAIVFVCEVCWAQDQDYISELFQKAMAIPKREDVELVIKGFSAMPRPRRAADVKEYEETRQALLTKADEAKTFLKRISETSLNWRECVTAKIILGWMDYPDLYAELWEWRAPTNPCRNPFPERRMHANNKFSQAGKKSVPIMMELLWKKGESHFGILPQLLSEWKIDSSIPVIVESISVYGDFGFPDIIAPALGSFGDKVTPYILEALKTSEQYKSEVFIKALGFTGDEKAVPNLLYLMKESQWPDHKKLAATSLGLLKKFSVLREEIFDINDTGTKMAILEVLGQDISEENHKFLFNFATNYEFPTMSLYNHIRLTAVKAILQNNRDEDIDTVCSIAPKEPDDYTRSCIYLYLARPNNKRVREVLLSALADEAEWVRVRAIDGLEYYDDNEVTKALLPFLQSKGKCKNESMYVLKSRRTADIVEPAIFLLEDEDKYLQLWAAEALERNPSKKATEALIKLFACEENAIRWRATKALVQIGGDRVLAALNEALKNEKDPWVKQGIEAGIKELSQDEKE